MPALSKDHSGSTTSPFGEDPLSGWENSKNIVWVGGCRWYGEVQFRWNYETQQREYFLALEFINLAEGWHTGVIIMSASHDDWTWSRLLRISDAHPAEMTTGLFFVAD